jgi:sugar/nucleoside kinase (ribokinase family)
VASEVNQVLVVGSIAFDDLLMPSGDFPDVLGGAATYSSIAASLLCPVRLVGVVGTDFPEKHVEMLKHRGVDCAGVERAKGKTFRWKGRYSEDLASRESLDTQLNVFADFRPKIPAVFEKSPFVLLGNIHPALQLEVLAQVQKPLLSIADTMNFWISGEPALLAKVLEKIDLLVINDEEARQLTGKSTVARAAHDIRKRGPKRVIIKRGEHGAILFDDAGAFFVPGFPLEEVHDPTGAGDAFAGGLMGSLARQGTVAEKSVRRAMFYASAVASFCVEGIGTTRLQTVTKPELASRIEMFAKMLDYGGTLALGDG